MILIGCHCIKVAYIYINPTLLWYHCLSCNACCNCRIYTHASSAVVAFDGILTVSFNSAGINNANSVNALFNLFRRSCSATLCISFFESSLTRPERLRERVFFSNIIALFSSWFVTSPVLRWSISTSLFWFIITSLFWFISTLLCWLIIASLLLLALMVYPTLPLSDGVCPLDPTLLSGNWNDASSELLFWPLIGILLLLLLLLLLFPALEEDKIGVFSNEFLLLLNLLLDLFAFK